VNNFLKWFGCACVIAGAVCVSLKIDPLNMYLLNLGALCYLAWGVRVKEWSQVTVNSALLLIYMGGIIQRLLS